MKTLPITNFEKFEKIIWSKPWSSNCKIIWYGMDATWHYQRKNNVRVGIEIKWKGNPFELGFNFNYVLEK